MKKIVEIHIPEDSDAAEKIRSGKLDEISVSFREELHSLRQNIRKIRYDVENENRT